MSIPFSKKNLTKSLGSLGLTLIGSDGQVIAGDHMQIFKGYVYYWFSKARMGLHKWFRYQEFCKQLKLNVKKCNKYLPDFTNRHVMIKRQSVLEAQILEQHKQLIDFCDIVSHNLKAPLANISMLAQFIEENSDPAEQKLLTSKLVPVIENLNNTFNNLVESIHIRTTTELRSENIYLKNIVREVIEDLAPEISSSMAIIEIDFDGLPNIWFPPEYLRSIFYNLISNAIRYQFSERPPVIKVQSRCINGNVCISVADNGRGIDLIKHKDSVFKLGKVFHYHPKAKGFGLFMIKTQIEAMNGKIWVESIPEVGSTFFIELKR